MTPNQRRRLNVRIARDLTAYVLADVIKVLKHGPVTHWDGLEVREYLADCFDRQRHMSNKYRSKEFSKRLRSYRKDELNLPNL